MTNGSVGEGEAHRRRVLLAAHPTAGHTNGLRAIGARLRERGHSVAFAIMGGRLPFSGAWPAPIQVGFRLSRSIAEEGLEVLPLAGSHSVLWHAARLPFKKGQAEMKVALSLFTTGLERQARQVAAHAERWRAEVVVGDYLMPAAMLGAELAKVPYVALYHSGLPFPVEGAPPFGSRLPVSARGTTAWLDAERGLAELSTMFDERIGSAARALGMPAYRTGLLTGLVSRDLNLLATVPALEPGLAPPSGPMVMVGPCLPRSSSPSATRHPALDVLPEAGFRVYVSLGTVFNGKPWVFERVLEGLEGLEAHVVVSAGSSYRRLKASPRGPRTHLFAQVPQVALLPQVDVVVTHGGNNTVQECLAAGRPMVVLPFGGDQIANAARVERLGVGEGLDVDALTPARLRQAVERARLGAGRASTLAKALEGLDGAGDAAAAVLALVEFRSQRIS